MLSYDYNISILFQATANETRIDIANKRAENILRK